MSPQSLTRVEGVDKVTGRAHYSADVRPAGMLYARILRSSRPHARVLRVDTSRAEQLPGVRAVLCRTNAPRIPWYEGSWLFDDTVRFVGDEIAAVAADSEEVAADALRLMEVDYEPLAFAVDDDSDDAGEATVSHRGDVAAAEGAAEVIVDEVYSTQTAVHNALEPHGCTAYWQDRTLVLHESTQGVFAVRAEVAGKLGIAEERVRVITEHMGGGFGAKQVAWKHSVIAALLARQAARPVQLMLDREAENLAVGNRQATRQRVRLGAGRDGRLRFIDADILVHGGAYSPGGESSMVAGIYQGLYACANVRVTERHRSANAGPSVAFRAPGYVEGAFALESAMDMLAQSLSLDPIELRLRNYTRTDQQKGKPYSSPEALRRCCEQAAGTFGWSSWKRPPGNGPKRRGIGFAVHSWVGGGGYPPGQAQVLRRSDGGAHLIVGVQDIGTGTRTALVQVAAETLGIPAAQVSISLGDTLCGLHAPVSSGSASLATLAPAVVQAAERAKSQPQGDGERGPNPDTVSVQTFGAQCAEVEVDVETGEVCVLRVVAAHDCGRVINPLLVESQVIGGVTQGLGYACTEARTMDRTLGLVLNPNLEGYIIPTIADVPQIVNATESMPDVAGNMIGVKGIGEPPVVPTAPAICNAIFDATGARVHDLPVLRERLLR